MSDLLARAEAFAARVHEGQVDRAGKPYIDHCRRVAVHCKSETAKAVALLHDVVEHGADISDVLDQFGHDIAFSVARLTHDSKCRTYLNYIRVVAMDPIAREVKIADLGDNMDLSRLPSVTAQDLSRQTRYSRARAILLSSLG